MNSDPHDSAAWRTFGMLDADEAFGFDEAMRDDSGLKNAYREIECLSAAVAAACTVPVTPRAGQLERLHLRLGLNAPKKTNWTGISGWAAAAVLTMLLVYSRTSSHTGEIAINPVGPSPAILTAPILSRQTPVTPVAPEPIVKEEDHGLANGQDTGPAQDENSLVASQDDEIKVTNRVETKRLIQEIDVLRGQLENFQQRDRKRFEAVPGMAWPVVVRMSPPGTAETPTLSVGDETPITALIGDALTAGTGVTTTGLVAPGITRDQGETGRNGSYGTTSLPDPRMSAVPIYDAARDQGTLVVSNLPPAGDAADYNLWVQTETGGGAIYVGKLPKSIFLAADSFDFSLGSIGIMPSGFVLTRDLRDAPVTPSEANTVLQGPK